MNNLKAFVRYDGSGHIVSGSLILRQFKPKVGNWEEIDAYECCKPSPSPENSLRLVFDDIINTTYLVDDASSVGDWNLYFDLPNYGSPFTSVSIEGNVVNLMGGSNIETRFGLFSNFDHLIEVDDTGTIVILGDETFACYNKDSLSILQRVSFPSVTRTIYETPETGDNYGCFGNCQVLEYANLPLLTNMEGSEFCDCYLLSTLIVPYNEITSLGCYAFAGCYLLTSLDFSNLITAGIGCFSNCTGLTSINFPSLTTVSIECFYGCESLTSLDLPVLTTAGDDCFSWCTSLTSINIPSLTTAGNYCFYNCTGLTFPYFSSLTTIGNGCFHSCTSLTTLNLPSCTNLGTTVGDDYVFTEIIGNTITLTIPSELMTCNGGNPDGDIQYLQANNTVTIITV